MSGLRVRSGEGRSGRVRDGVVPVTLVVAIVLTLVVSACDDSRNEVVTSRTAAEIPNADEIPRPNLAEMEPRVQFIVRDAQAKVLADLGAAKEWGRYAMILDAHGVHAAAIQAYSVAQRLAPREFRWAYLLAHVLELQEFEQIELDLVESALRSARDLNQSYAPLYVRWGSVLLDQGKHEEARAAFQRAKELDGSLAAATAGLTRALLLMGETESALESIKPFAAENPRNWEVQMLLARAYSVTGDRGSARRAAEHARSLPQVGSSPDPIVSEMLAYAVSATACFKRARSLALTGDYEGAVMNLKVVAEVRPDYAAVQERLGWCYLRMQKLKLSRRHFDRAIELEPDLVEAHLGLAQTLQALTLPDEARAAEAEGERLKSAAERP